MNDDTHPDSKDSGEYEDDFEKDLEWLISENEKSDASEKEEEEYVAGRSEDTIQQDLEKDLDPASPESIPNPTAPWKDEAPACRNDYISVPSIQAPEPASDSDSEGSLDARPDEDEDEQVRRYIMEKITQANRLLQCQDPVNEKRSRRLKFKDKVVDLEVPPLEDPEASPDNPEHDGSSMSGQLSRLCISSRPGPEMPPDKGLPEESKDGKVLVERDGKFELLNFRDLESQGLPSDVPPVPDSNGDLQVGCSHLASPSSSEAGQEEPVAVFSPASAPPSPPQASPPLMPSARPRPASSTPADIYKGVEKFQPRAQSAYLSPASSTYCLSPRQKDLQRRLEQKRAKLKREEEQKRIEEAKEKRKENDQVFKAWLQKKREQVLEMRRIQRAKQMENLNSRQENRDPQHAFRLWLKKKHEEQLKEKKTEELRKQEECLYFLRGTEGRERAFKQWLKRKQIEKLTQQQMAKERTRQLRLEAKRAKQRQSVCVPEAKSFRYPDPYK